MNLLIKNRNKIISNLLAFALIIALTSCDANMYIDPANSSKAHFSPPSWIIGVWISKEADTIHSPRYEILEFTDGNFIGSAYNDQYRESFNHMINANSWAYEVLYEIKKSDEYEVVIKYLGNPSSHRFVKILDNQIMYHYLHNKDLSEPGTPILYQKTE